MKKRRVRTITGNQIFFIVSIFLLGSVVAYTVKSLYKVNELKMVVATKPDHLNQINLLSKQTDELKELWHQQQQLVRQIESKIPSAENLPELIAELSDLADQATVSITELTLASPSELDLDALQTMLDLSVQGSYNNIKTYLGLLLTANRHFAIETVELSQAIDNNRVQDLQKHPWVARISLSTFFLPPFSATITSDQS